MAVIFLYLPWTSAGPIARNCFSYTYDQAGRLISLQNFNSILTTYGYDNANRLIDLENRRSDTNAIAAYQFSLDANGNRVQIDETAPITRTVNSGTVDYTYNDMKNRLLTAGPSNFTYDLDGQLAGLDSTTYAFDYEHRLTSISGTDSIQYAYDGSGNRLEAVRDGVTTRYIYDAAGNLLAEADGLNNITRYYIHGQGLLAMVNPADEIYCYHFDAIGSTIAMTDETQAMVNTYAYTPFGSIANEQESLPQSFKYVGQHGVMAEPNGFYYMRARYYDPEVGRFISEDPIGFGGGDVNLYAYVGNNPILFVDPWGLCSESANTYQIGPVHIDVEPGAWDLITAGAGLASAHIPYLAVAPGAGPAAPIPLTVGITGMTVGAWTMWQGFSLIEVTY
jgi:RHS repeat-associated protein